MNISSIFYFSKLTSISTQHSSQLDTLKMMLFTKKSHKMKMHRQNPLKILVYIWRFNLISSVELDIKRYMLYLSNVPLTIHILHNKTCQTLQLVWYSIGAVPACKDILIQAPQQK